MEDRSCTILTAKEYLDGLTENFDYYIKEKLNCVLAKVGFRQLLNRDLQSWNLEEQSLVAEIPVVSVEAARVFRQYKAFFPDNRQSMTKENINFHCIVLMKS